MKLVNALMIANVLFAASIASAKYEFLKLDPAIIIGHYGSGLQLSENKQSLLIQTYIKTDGKNVAQDPACKDLGLGIQSSLDEISEFTESKNLFKMEVSSYLEGTLSNNKKYICVIELESLDSRFTFKKIKTDLFSRADYYTADESDLKTIKIVDDLRNNVLNINYFHAKHTYFPIKSFIEYVQVQQSK